VLLKENVRPMARPEKSWTPEQIRFIEWSALPKYERFPPSQEMLAEELNVDRKTLWRWTQIEEFTEAVNAMARVNMVKQLPSIYGALLRKADAGHYEHIKLVMEMTGEYIKQQKNINENEGQMTVRFVVGDAQPLIETDDEDI
jgi:hypothetical protein